MKPTNFLVATDRAPDLVRGRTGTTIAGVGTLAGSPLDLSSAPADGQGWVYDEATDTWVLAALAVSPTIGSPSAPTTVVNANYSAFPTLTHLDKSHVLMVYRRGTDHATSLDGNLYYRVGTIAASDAITWSGESTFWNHATLDLRDPSAMTARDGTIFVTVCTADGTNISDNFVGYVIACTWNGSALTIGTPTAIGSSLAAKREIPMRMVQLPDGSFMLPICGLTSGSKDKVIVSFSANGTTGWGSEVVVASSASFFYTEPVAVLYDDGSIGCLIRENDGRTILSTFSYDLGQTWSTLTSEGAGWGKPMHRQLDSGADLLVVREDDGTTTGRALYLLSYDRGVTWSAPAALGAAKMLYADVLPLAVPGQMGGGRTVLVACSTENSSTDADIVTVTFSDIDDVRYGVGQAANEMAMKAAAAAAVPSFATPAIVLGTAAAAGAAATVIRSDGTIKAFNNVTPAAVTIDGAAVIGTSAYAAEADHGHPGPTTTALLTAIPAHVHVAYETHTSDGSTTTFTLDQVYEPGSVMAWNRTAGTLLGVTEVEPDQATVSAAGTAADLLDFHYAASVI